MGLILRERITLILVQDISRYDRKFLVNVFSYAAHLSNAFNATYFPVRGESGFTDAAHTESMGTLLNFYKSATTTSLKNYVAGERQLLQGNLTIGPIELFKMNDYISILELEEVLSKENIYPNSKRLIETQYVGYLRKSNWR